MNVLSRKDQPSKAQERARLVVGIFGLIIVVGFVVAAAIVDRERGSSPPHVRVVSIERAAANSAEAFTATVENTGDITGEQVVVRGTVGDEDPVDHEIDFLAPGEEAEVSFIGSPGTTKDDITVQVLAWTAAE